MQVVERRGGALEAVHPVSAVLVGPDGRIHDRVGPPLVTTWRSAAKPFQLEGSLSLLGDPPDLSPEDLAIGAASHAAEPGHLRQVERVLARFGCVEADLYCGAHAPGNEAAAHALIREGRAPTPIHNNCSGKHAYMAAATRARGWARDYRPPDHPTQSALRAVVERRTGGVNGAVVDGCGVPCFVLPLEGMARAWAALALDTQSGAGVLGRIGRAMLAHPWLVSGTSRVDGELMRQARRPLVAKVGAQALLCLAVPEQGVGIAVKAHSGNNDARAVATFALLDRWFPGLLPEGADAPWRVVRNWVGDEVGERVIEGT